MVLGPMVRAGSKLIKKGLGTGKRKMVDKDGKVITVNASTRTVKQPEGLGSPKSRAIGKKVQNKPAAKKRRKFEGEEVANVRNPSGGGFGKTADNVSDDIPNYLRTAKTTKEYDKVIIKTEKELEKQKEKLKELKEKLKGYKRFESKFPDMPKSIKEKIETLKEAITLNKAKLTGRHGMKTKGGPRVLKRKTGGQVMKKAGGGKMSHVGLYPAEEARSGTMSEKKRAKNMAYGGKVKKYNKGGRINTSRENRLEELGRVDAEKAHTSKGKRNLRSEKKRIVKELTGNDFVASYYD